MFAKAPTLFLGFIEIAKRQGHHCEDGGGAAAFRGEGGTNNKLNEKSYGREKGRKENDKDASVQRDYPRPERVDG